MTTVERLRVVLGEADTSRSPLRFVLEGEGFHLIGMAGCDDELPRVLAGARPSVVVLDAGISAPAALEVRERYPDVPLVLVWPQGVVAVLAAARVDPADVVTELGPAVRRAAARAAARRALEECPAEPVAPPPLVGIVRTPSRPAGPPRPRPAAGRRQVSRPTAFVAAVSLLYVLVGTSVALGLPYALNRALHRPMVPRGSPSKVVVETGSSQAPAAPIATTSARPPGDRAATGQPVPQAHATGTSAGHSVGPTRPQEHAPSSAHPSRRDHAAPDHPSPAAHDPRSKRSDHAAHAGPQGRSHPPAASR